jgi:hypothetical protein
MTARRAAWLLTAAVLAGAAGTAVVWVAKGSFGETEGRIMFSLVGIFLSLAVAVASLRLLELRRVRPIAFLALAAVPFELASFVYASWYGYVGDGSSEIEWYLTALAWVTASLVVTTLAVVSSNRRVTWTLLPANFLSAVAGASIATVLVWTEADDADLGRALACLGIVTAGSWLLALPLQNLLPWRRELREPAES